MLFMLDDDQVKLQCDWCGQSVQIPDAFAARLFAQLNNWREIPNPSHVDSKWRCKTCQEKK